MHLAKQTLTLQYFQLQIIVDKVCLGQKVFLFFRKKITLQKIKMAEIIIPR